MNKIDEIKKKIENVRDLIIIQDGEAFYDCNFRELEEVLALLESAKAEPEHVAHAKKTIAGWPEWKREINRKLLDLNAKAEQPPEGEFANEEDLVQRVRKAIAFIDPLGKQSKIDRRKVPDNAILELCRRLDVQAKEIEVLKAKKVEQPEGEFTKRLKKDSARYSQDAQYTVREACRRLDALDAQKEELLFDHGEILLEIEKLKAELQDQVEQYHVALSEIVRLTAENKNLLVGITALKMQVENTSAENTEFREAHRQYCNTINRMDVNAEQMDTNYGQMVLERDALKAENKALTERIAELEKRPDFTKGGHDVSKFYPDEALQPQEGKTENPG